MSHTENLVTQAASDGIGGSVNGGGGEGTLVERRTLFGPSVRRGWRTTRGG